MLRISLCVLIVACGGGKKADTTNAGDPMVVTGEKTLYDRLGGKDAITAVVDELVANILADKRINALFANADLPSFKKKLADQICQAAKGPCVYTGKGMKEAHVNMSIKKADFDALVEDLVAALKKFNVGEQEQRDLLGLLGPMEKDIVTAQ